MLSIGPRRVNHASVAIDDFIYSFGGYCSGEDYRSSRPMDVHVLNTSDLRWKLLPIDKDLKYPKVPFQRYGKKAIYILDYQCYFLNTSLAVTIPSSSHLNFIRMDMDLLNFDRLIKNYNLLLQYRILKQFSEFESHIKIRLSSAWKQSLFDFLSTISESHQVWLNSKFTVKLWLNLKSFKKYIIITSYNRMMSNRKKNEETIFHRRCLFEKEMRWMWRNL